MDQSSVFDIVSRPNQMTLPNVEAVLDTVESGKAVCFSLNGLTVAGWRNRLFHEAVVAAVLRRAPHLLQQPSRLGE
jgi:hypothetical protein